jgi:hypothetical protein
MIVRRLSESAIGLGLLILTFLLGLAGLVSDLIDWGDPAAFFGVAVVFGIAAASVAHDEQRRTAGRYRWTEALFGRGLIVLALVLALVSFGLAIVDSPYRNLWLVLAVIVDLVGLAVVVDSHRLIVARASSIATRTVADGIFGAIAGALALGLGVVGVVAGSVDNAHAPAWLFAGVVLAVLSVALMFDEQAQVIAQARAKRGAFVPPPATPPGP